MFGVFNWVRRSVKTAFLAGLQDGIDAAMSVDADAGDAPPVTLRLTFHPVPAADAVAEKDGEAEAVGNGRRKAKAGG